MSIPWVFLPSPPIDIKDEALKDWIKDFTLSVEQMFHMIKLRFDNAIIQGGTSDRPTANGSKRFYYDTDTDTLYYDDGVWNAI